MNHRVDIREDIKRYQDTLSYTSSKADYSTGENICMLPSDKNLKLRSGTVGYNNKILVSDGNISLGKNDKVNASEASVMKSHQIIQPTITHKNQKPTHNEEKVALVLFLTGGYAIWNPF